MHLNTRNARTSPPLGDRSTTLSVQKTQDCKKANHAFQTVSYVSEIALRDEDRDACLMRILAQAQCRNTALGVTGVLILRGNIFLQTLEGPANAVNALFSSIRQDKRHHNIYVLLNEPLQERRFGDWAMEGFHDPRPGPDFQATLHRIGRHFFDKVDYSPTQFAIFVWKMISKLASHRVVLTGPAAYTNPETVPERDNVFPSFDLVSKETSQ